MLMRRNKYLDELGIPRGIYGGNFVHEKKLMRLRQRVRYGFDYCDIFNMDVSFAEWLYSHMRMYKDCSVHDDRANSVSFEGKEYTIEEAVDWIIEKTGIFLRHSYYIDAHFDYIARHPVIGKMICKLNPAVGLYFQEICNAYEQDPNIYEDDRYKAEEGYIKASEMFLKIIGHCWL